MKLTPTFYLVFSIGVATASKVMPRSLAADGCDFASREYDYVVIGGGTAGLVVAARLAEDPWVEVGVIEAGEYMPDDPIIETPSSSFQLQNNPKYDWMLKSTPQEHLSGRTLNLPRGKVLGGSSAIGVLTSDRAPKNEHDAWASLGSPGWDWDGILPYMKAAERFTGADPFRVNYTDADPKHTFPSQGTNGPLALGYNNWYSDVVNPYWNAIKKQGVPVNYDPDSGNPFGTYNTPREVDDATGKRTYSANTYYEQNAHRPNLVVLTKAQATKIEFDKSGDKIKAKGVSFVHDSKKYTVTAKKEVILSAGAFHTPHILELSGVGNSKILSKYGIDTLVDLPGVGENLQDHVFATVGYELKPGVVTMDNLRFNATLAAAAREQYESTRDGMLTNSVALLSFIDPSFIANSSEMASITSQLHREIERDGATPLEKAQFKIQKDWLKKKVGHVELILIPSYFGPATPKNDTSYASVLLVAQHPFSRGSVHLNTSDPLAVPEIDPNFLSKTIDQDTLVQSIKFTSKIFETEPLASLVVARAYPGPEVTSDADLVEYVKGNTRPTHHHLGTAAMASRELGGVVDPELKVYGTLNLRVVDASVMPIHMNFHPSRTVYGIGEKGADIIKKSS